MKRLKNLLLGMEPNSQTFWEIYEGRAVVCPPPAGKVEPETVSDPTYWHEDIGFTLTQTNKHALDQPTVTIAIPAKRLGLTFPKTAEKAAADFCLREIAPVFDELNAVLYNRKRPDKENGKYILHTPGSEVLVRNTAFFAQCRAKDYENGNGCVIHLKKDLSLPPVTCLCVRLKIQLPFKKSKKTLQMLCRDLPRAVMTFCERFDGEKLAEAVALSQKQTEIRAFIKESKFCAFIADGSVLPRGKDGGPLPNAVPFAAPPGQKVTVCGVPGFGVRRGVTVITGGGYSGKSTVLDAIAAGIYDHVGGDGRELVLTDETAVSIAAEDGRCVQNVNIAPFIRWIPGGDPAHFSTGHASGSTSQAANIVEAVEAGSRLLLIDEDRSATNFMIRDKMMKELVEKEPILPFTDRVNELSRKAGVSTILVIGGSGEYLSVADQVLLMDDFIMKDATEKARAICAHWGAVAPAAPAKADWHNSRLLAGEGFSAYPKGSGTERLFVSEFGFLSFGDEQVDLRGLYNLATTAQQTALAFYLRHLAVTNAAASFEPSAALDALLSKTEQEGLDAVFSSFFTDCDRFLDQPRKIELLLALFRMRHVRFLPAKGR